MNKLKELWQYAVFRWCVYFTPLLVFGLLLEFGALDADSYEIDNKIFGTKSDIIINATLIWILIFALPAVWVWRKPIWKMVK